MCSSSVLEIQGSRFRAFRALGRFAGIGISGLGFVSLTEEGSGFAGFSTQHEQSSIKRGSCWLHCLVQAHCLHDPSALTLRTSCLGRYNWLNVKLTRVRPPLPSSSCSEPQIQCSNPSYLPSYLHIQAFYTLSTKLPKPEVLNSFEKNSKTL